MNPSSNSFTEVQVVRLSKFTYRLVQGHIGAGDASDEVEEGVAGEVEEGVAGDASDEVEEGVADEVEEGVAGDASDEVEEGVAGARIIGAGDASDEVEEGVAGDASDEVEEGVAGAI